MEIIDAIGKIINFIILSIVALLFIVGAYHQAIELIKKK